MATVHISITLEAGETLQDALAGLLASGGSRLDKFAPAAEAKATNNNPKEGGLHGTAPAEDKAEAILPPASTEAAPSNKGAHLAAARAAKAAKAAEKAAAPAPASKAPTPAEPAPEPAQAQETAPAAAEPAAHISEEDFHAKRVELGQKIYEKHGTKALSEIYNGFGCKNGDAIRERAAKDGDFRDKVIAALEAKLTPAGETSLFE